MDELAEAAGKDAIAFRLDLLKDKPRHAGVLKLAAEKADWDQPLPNGRFRGVAVAESFKTYVAQIAEASGLAEFDVEYGVGIKRDWPRDRAAGFLPMVAVRCRWSSRPCCVATWRTC